MRKRLISETLPSPGLPAQEWLDLDRIASVEVTSEENEYPIESALLRAKNGVGVQLVREPR